MNQKPAKAKRVAQASPIFYGENPDDNRLCFCLKEPEFVMVQKTRKKNRIRGINLITYECKDIAAALDMIDWFITCPATI